MNIATQCRATASDPLAKKILVDGGSGFLAELLLDAAKAIEALAEQPAQPLTDADYYNACLSYRHDFGLMSDEDRQKLVFEAKEWARAFGITKGNT